MVKLDFYLGVNNKENFLWKRDSLSRFQTSLADFSIFGSSKSGFSHVINLKVSKNITSKELNEVFQEKPEDGNGFKRKRKVKQRRLFMGKKVFFIYFL